MKKLYFLLGFLVIISLNSCTNDNEDYYIEHVNRGNISLNAYTYPIYYADIYNFETYPNGGIGYQVTLTDNFAINGTTKANIALYLEIYKPYNDNIEGTYYLNYSNGKAIDFVQYHKNVTFSNGTIINSKFTIPYTKFTAGTFIINYIGNNRYRIEYQLQTLYKDFITGIYEGKISGN